ncbi:MAG TPA: RHS repeat-associated core domain-containing protein, partial [Bryobacteraceae bacterium]
MKAVNFCLLVSTAAAVFAQSTVTIPSTGATTAATDPNWTIISNQVAGESGTGPAHIVTKLGGSWYIPAPGLNWIGPDPDQSNATRPGTCCVGYMNYQTTFTVQDPSTAGFTFQIAADEGITVYLNGMADSDIVFSLDTPNYNAPVTVTVKQGVPYNLPDGGPPNVPHFNAGTNTLTISIGNLTGGPTGLYINNGKSAGSSTLTDASIADGHNDAAPDPIDAGTGQFYDTELDARLGGPLDLSFARYYASQLSKSGFTSSLGTNWMSNFDIVASVSSSKAEVLLFKGRLVTFINTTVGFILQSPVKLPYQFHALSGGGYEFLDAERNLIYTFNNAGALTKIQDRNGNALTITSGSAGPLKVTDGFGRSLTFAYTGSQLASVTDQSGRITSFTYAGGTLASATDPLGALTKYAYSASGAYLTKETLPLGNAPVTQTYDSTGRAVSQTNATNNVSTLAYDGSGGVAVTQPSGAITQQKSDAAGNLLSLTDPDGGTASVTYDPQGRRKSIIDKTGANYAFTYDNASGQVSTVQLPDNSTTTYTYALQLQNGFAFRVLSNIAYPDATATAITRDANGNIASITGPDQSVWGFTYDPAGDLTSTTGPVGDLTAYVWNPDGTMGSVIDAAGNTATYQYDGSKRVSQFTDANGSTAQYTYDGDGRVTTAGRPGQTAWTSHYNLNGLVDSIVNPLGAKSSVTYTDNNQVSTVTNPAGSTTTYQWDPQGLLANITNAAGESQIFTRDSAGRVTSVSDNSGQIQSRTYDADGRPASVTDGDGLTATYGYDANGRMNSLTTPSGAIWQDTYNWRGQPVTRTNPLGEQSSIGRDIMGRVTSVTDPGSFSASITRDAYGNPLSFVSANGATWTMTLDPIGRLATRTDPYSNVTNYTYTGTRLTHVDLPLGTADFMYDAAGNRTKSTYSDGTIVSQQYNGLNLRTGANGVTIKRNSMGLPTSVNGIDITVDAAGRPLTYTYAPGMVVTYTYDSSGRLSTVADWVGGTTTFQYSQGSRIANITYPSGLTTTYGYDANGVRNSIHYGALASIDITRNDAGRIVSAERNLPVSPALTAGTQALDTNPGGQLAAATYDAMGRVTSLNSRNYTWNLANQLVSYSDPVNSASFTYDGFGAMNSRTISGVTQNFVVNHATAYPSLAIIRQDGADLRYFVYSPDGLLLYSIEASNNERNYYHFDEIGNTAFLTDDTGVISDSYAITPYGEIADHPGMLDNPFTWQGQYGVMSEPGGLYYMRNRHYDSTTSRFLSPDPHQGAEPQASEPYAYARANPLLYVDPFGTNPLGPQDIQTLNLLITTLVKTDPKNPDLTIFEDEHTIWTFHPDMDGAAIFQEASAEAAAPPATGCAHCTTNVPVSLSSSTTLASTALSTTSQNILTQEITQLISQDGSGLIAKQISQVISNDGGSIVGDNGGGVVSNDGGSLAAQIVQLIGQDGSGAVAHDLANLIGQDGSGLIGQDG